MRFPKQPPDYIQQGVKALTHYDIPGAYRAFAAAYQHHNWETRDLAVTALGDMLDVAVYEGKRKPGVLVIIQSKEDLTFQAANAPVDPPRLMVLLEGFLQRALVPPQTLAEQKYLSALRDTLALVEKILLNDPHHLVRFSAFIVLDHILGKDRQHFIVDTLRQALRQEPHPALCAALDEALKRG